MVHLVRGMLFPAIPAPENGILFPEPVPESERGYGCPQNSQKSDHRAVRTFNFSSSQLAQSADRAIGYPPHISARLHGRPCFTDPP